MKFAGYNPCSLSDFPGRVAAVLFAQGCNFRCPFCHNGQLIPPEGDVIALSAIMPRLLARRGLIDGVVVSGGEPTLQAGLPDFLSTLKQSGLQVKLDTNGSVPDMVARLADAKLVDYIAMDVKAPWRRYHELAGVPVRVDRIEESVRLIAASGIPHEFRTTAVRALLSEADLAEIRAQIPGGSSYRVLPFRAANALDPRLRREMREETGCRPK